MFAKKDCLHCYHTHPFIFDGTCPVAGEIDISYAERVHTCWKPWTLKLWLKWWLEPLTFIFKRKKHGRSKQL